MKTAIVLIGSLLLTGNAFAANDDRAPFVRTECSREKLFWGMTPWKCYRVDYWQEREPCSAAAGRFNHEAQRRYRENGRRSEDLNRASQCGSTKPPETEDERFDRVERENHDAWLKRKELAKEIEEWKKRKGRP